MKQKIIGVLGLGRFGYSLALELSTFGQEVIALDNKANHVEAVADFVSKSAIGDITDLDFLKAIGIEQCDLVVIATGNNLESSVLALMHCKKLGINHIIAKANNTIFEEVLYEIGADRVISPERESGKNLASTLMRHNITDIYHLEEDIAVMEFHVPQEWLGKSVLELNVRKQFDINLIGLRADKGASLSTNFDINAPLKEGNIIVAVANKRTFEKYDYLGYLK